jgi:hypothetical protein
MGSKTQATPHFTTKVRCRTRKFSPSISHLICIVNPETRCTVLPRPYLSGEEHKPVSKAWADATDRLRGELPRLAILTPCLTARSSQFRKSSNLSD